MGTGREEVATASPLDLPVDVFFCTAPQSHERSGMASDTLATWLDTPHVRLHVLTPLKLGCSLVQFNRYRRIWADSESPSSVYILTDDDASPLGTDFIQRGLAVMATHPQFAILSAWPVNCKINPWEKATVPDDGEVLEHVSVGVLRFCRKGALEDWPAANGGPGYDMQQSEALRRAGWHVGLMRRVKAEHLGEGKSELWRPGQKIA